MKSLLIIVVCSSLVGVVMGAAIAYYEAQPPTKPIEALGGGPTNEPVFEVNDSSPRAIVPEVTFEFGTMEHRATMRHEYAIRNEGESELVIAFASSTCNCTRVELGGKLAEKGVSVSVPPGEATEVMLEWTAKISSGAYRHGAYFNTNDPKTPRIGLSVEGEVVESTALRPSELQFGAMRSDETREAYLYLLSYSDQQVEVLDYQLTGKQLPEQLEVRIEPLSPDQLLEQQASGGVKVVASYRAGKTLGPFGGSLKLETTLENTKMITVPILGWVEGDISVYGPGWVAQGGLLKMGTFQSKQGKKMRLTMAVRGPYAQTTRFEVDRTDPPELKVTFGEPREMGDQLMHVPLFVEIPAGTRPMVRLGEPASTDAEIVLRSTHPVSTVVRLRVQFAVGQ